MIIPGDKAKLVEQAQKEVKQKIHGYILLPLMYPVLKNHQ